MAGITEQPTWTLRQLAAVPRALVELARARMVLAGIDPVRIAALNENARAIASQASGSHLTIPQIAQLVPAAARLAPWRSDCLVQAIAAQRWLAREGHAGEIVLGVERTETGIAPHGWLRIGETVVTGGPIDRYTVLTGGGAQGERIQ